MLGSWKSPAQARTRTANGCTPPCLTRPVPHTSLFLHRTPVTHIACSAPQQVAAAPVYSEQQLDALWESTPRALLKLGKGGAQSSHARSLEDLLPAHSLVKVQLNGNPARAEEVGQQLAAMADGACLLGVRGPHMLFTSASGSTAKVLEAAQQSKKKQEAYHQKRKQARIDAEAAAEMERQTGVPAEQQPQRQRQPQSDRVSSSQGASSSSSERDTGINKLISKVSKKGGGMTRSSLKSEWEDLERSIYETEIAEAEAEARQARSAGKKQSPPSATQRPGATEPAGGGNRSSSKKQSYRSH